MKSHKSLALFALAIAGMSLVGCTNDILPSEEPATPSESLATSPKPNNLVISSDKTISSYIKGMNFDADKIWEYDLTGSVRPKGERTSEVNGDRLVVTKKEVRTAKSGTASLHSLQLSNLLYPGQLLKANSKLVEGVPTAITSLDRGKASYEVVLPGLYDNVFSIEETTGALFRSRLGAKVAQWKDLGKKLTANQTFSLTQTYDASQLAVDLGFGIAEKLKIDANYKQGGETNIFIASFEQIFYNVNLVVEGKQTVVFDPEVTLEDVQHEITDKEPPLLITQANYGQTIYLKIETTMDKKEVNAGLSYAGKVDAKAKVEFNKMLANCKVNCLVYGGIADDYQQLTPIEGEESADKINELLNSSKTPLAENVENAVMLSYATSWLKNNDFARIGATTEYLETTYEVIDAQKVTLHNRGVFTVKEWKVLACPITGWDDKGNPIFGNLEKLYGDTEIFTGQDRIIHIPANYGRVEFHYDIRAGSNWPFRGRIYGNDFFKNAEITTRGTTFNSYVILNVDGRESRI